MTYDVVVVGARCAGASVARLMSASGIRVLLVDRSQFPSDTISTHCITLPGLRQLGRWGLLRDIIATSAPLVRNFNLEIGNERKPGIFGRGQGEWTLAPRRLVLDSVLIEAASGAGVTIWQGAQVTQVLPDPNHGTRIIGTHASGRNFDATATIVVGADGRKSIVARKMGASIKRSEPSRLGGWYAYYSGMPIDVTTWTFGKSTSAGSFPTNDGLACVWSMCDLTQIPRGTRERRSLFLSALRSASDSLFNEVSSAQVVSRLVSFDSYPGFMRTQFGSGWALVGDAGYFSHPIIAHGISDAFRGAQLLADAICSALNGECSWNEAALCYADRQQAAIRGTFEATQRIASLDWSLCEILDVITLYKTGVQATLTLENEWWGSCDLASAI